MKERVGQAQMQTLLEAALAAGFDHAAPIAQGSLVAYDSVRDMCKENRCGQYGACWICPPCCGTIEACQARMDAYPGGLLVQTVGQIEDSFDYTGMRQIELRHQALFEQFDAYLKRRRPNVLALGAGACHICSACACPDAPCRFPERALSSMEAYGLLVLEVCKRNGLAYYYGPERIAFIGCYLF